ncbi:hypothetical protein NQ315_016712, partial [Exocentrus adspersus]
DCVRWPSIRREQNRESKIEYRRTTYSEEQLQQALQQVKDGASKKTVARKYGIPRQTIQFRLGKKFTKTEKDSNTYLTKLEEETLTKNRHTMSVKSFLDANRRPNPFKVNIPGNSWCESFLKRHPILTQRTSEAVTSASANVSSSDIKKWFVQIENYSNEKGYFDILSDPS